MNKVIIIAEAGVNHNGDINLAKKLIDIASGAGVDYVKFQTWITEELIDKSAPKAEYQKLNDGEATSQYEMLKALELSFGQFRELKSYCDKKNVGFLSTPDEEKSLDFLVDDLGVELIKVGSGEVTNIPYLRKIGNKKKDVILSTGMSNLGDVELAYNTLLDAGAKNVALLHCTSNYPAPYNSVNLKAMLTLREAFKTDVGYSDHTEGIAVSLAAVALGATIIEKHFTIDKTLPGPDHKASMDPNELKALVVEIRNIEMALSGNGKKEIQISEKEIKSVVTKGIYLLYDIKEGEIITENMLVCRRPAKFIASNQFDLIVGKKVSRNINKGNSLKLSDIDFD
ncbi:MAG: N-acetylneuraminate synthase [Bacteroidetes bacterium]|nr:N-acetylneuraminate synthase [Bacteroidota bacterium]